MPPCTRELWTYLLRKVNYVDNGKFKRGQGFFSLEEIQSDLAWWVGYRRETYSKPDLTKALRRLREGNMIETTKEVRGVVVTVCKYDYYQDSANYEGNAKETRRKEYDATGVFTILEEGKKGTKEEGRRKKNTAQVALVWPFWATENFSLAWDRWKAYRAEDGHKYKPIGEQSAITKLGNEFTNEADAIAAIEYSMGNGWKGIFAPRQQNSNGHGKPSTIDQKRAAIAELFAEDIRAAEAGGGYADTQPEGL